MNPFQRRGDPHHLVVGMIGAKMGDRLLQIGCAHAGRLGAVVAKVGLSGHAVAVVADDRSAGRARRGAAASGALVEVEQSPANHLPLADGTFDLAVVDDTDGSIGNLREEDRMAAFRELFRVLRPGGRAVFLETAARRGLAALLTGARRKPAFDPAPGLQVEGFRSVRMLAEREGLRFVEALKPR
jgi:arsenite methyltransferase